MPLRDASGEPIATYSNDHIMTFARAWTGFKRRGFRRNLEARRGLASPNWVDASTIRAEWRDVFPKMDLYAGYLGDGYPLCAELPPRTFLRRGATYRYLGYKPWPVLQADPTAFDEYAGPRLTLAPSSALRAALCGSGGSGACTYPSDVALSASVACDGAECSVDMARVVGVYDAPLNRTVWYEYVPPPCVELTFYDNGVKVVDGWRKLCAPPSVPAAGAVCCTSGSSNPQGVCSFLAERTTQATAAARCANAGLQLCSSLASADFGCGYEDVYSWTSAECTVSVQVDAQDGWVNVIQSQVGQDDTRWARHRHLRRDSQNLFPVRWAGGRYPTPADGCNAGVGAACQVSTSTAGEESCVCGVSISSTAVYASEASLPSSVADLVASLTIGAPSIDQFDAGAYVRCTSAACAAASAAGYDVFTTAQSGGTLDASSIFRAPINGTLAHRLNRRSTVAVGSAFSFRNAPRFVSFVEPTMRDAQHETDALLDHLVYHRNTAPFIAHRLIQRFVTSNPSPRYVAAVADAFRTGTSGGRTHSGGYADLGATVSTILLDREARSSTLDAEPSHGQLREPLLKLLHVFRSLEYVARDGREIELHGVGPAIGQEAYHSPTVFNVSSRLSNRRHWRLRSLPACHRPPSQVRCPPVLAPCHGSFTRPTSNHPAPSWRPTCTHRRRSWARRPS